MEKHKWYQKRGDGPRRRTQPYNIELKKRILSDYLSGKLSFTQLSFRYGVPKATISNWYRVCKGNPANIVYIDGMEKKGPRPKDDSDKISSRESDLKKALELEKIKNEALELLIKKAEEHFNISIKKKFDTK